MKSRIHRRYLIICTLRPAAVACLGHLQKLFVVDALQFLHIAAFFPDHNATQILKNLNIYQRWVRCGIGRVQGCLSVCVNEEGRPAELIFDQMCFGFNSAAAFFSSLHRSICIEIIGGE